MIFVLGFFFALVISVPWQWCGGDFGFRRYFLFVSL